MLEPFMPETSNEIFRQLNIEKCLIPDTFGLMIELDHKISEPVPLFRKLEDAEINNYREKFAGAVKKENKEEGLQVLVTEKSDKMVPEIEKKVAEQGDIVRKMKSEKKDKKDIDSAVKGTC